MRDEYYAHTSDDNRENEKLIDHLLLTGELAARNGQSFSQSEVCRQLGLLHDVGKRSEDFQRVLEHRLVKQDHAIISAFCWSDLWKNTIKSKYVREHMSLVLASHHSYLYTDKDTIQFDFMSSRIPGERVDDLYVSRTKDKNKEIVVKTQAEYQDILTYILDNQLCMELTDEMFLDVKGMTLNEKMFYVRMLLSCLVDADYSATAEYDSPGYLDKYVYPNLFQIDVFLQRFDAYYTHLLQQVKPSEMNDLRKRVYNCCATKGSLDSNFFTLTAPTGSGKTLSLMKFALEQAKSQKKDRIIIVLPFLTIIEQNAKVYQDIFGEDVVLVDDSETEYTDEIRVLSDRWSSPIIVTTSVKFFETLFACKTTSLRKLHHIANSVVVFDECQTLPSHLLNSTIEVLSSLVKYYNTTVLFSTATCPDYRYRESGHYSYQQKKGRRFVDIVHMQWDAKELMDDVQDVFTCYGKIKNTKVSRSLKPMSCVDLMQYFPEDKSAVFIFNTVKHAEEMYQCLLDEYGSSDCFLITSRFCSIDKQAIIRQVNERLQNGHVVRLVATQCIEAGVDFDFDCGAREYAPLDSIIQSAGRVNRHCNGFGEFLVFDYVNHGRYDYPSMSYKVASDISRYVIGNVDTIDFYDLSFMNQYFKHLYQSPDYAVDSEKLLQAIGMDDFEEVSKQYCMIQNANQVTMIVRPIHGTEKELELFDDLVQELQQQDFRMTKKMMKRLMPYSLSVFASQSFEPSDFGNPLSLCSCGHESFVNWYLVTMDGVYTDCGFNTKMDIGGLYF